MTGLRIGSKPPHHGVAIELTFQPWPGSWHPQDRIDRLATARVSISQNIGNATRDSATMITGLQPQRSDSAHKVSTTLSQCSADSVFDWQSASSAAPASGRLIIIGQGIDVPLDVGNR